MTELPTSAQRVEAALRAAGCDAGIVEMPASTATAADAARACDCDVAQIVKSLVFRGVTSGRAHLILTSGANRVDETKVGELVGESIERAAPDFVRDTTGYAIGGVPPVGHLTEANVVIDADLLTHGVVWAAAGTPRCVFPVDPQQLAVIAGATVAEVS